MGRRVPAGRVEHDREEREVALGRRGDDLVHLVEAGGNAPNVGELGDLARRNLAPVLVGLRV